MLIWIYGQCSAKDADDRPSASANGMCLSDLWPVEHSSRYPGFIAHDMIYSLQGYMGSGSFPLAVAGRFYLQGELKTHIGSDVVPMWAGVADSAGNVPLSLDSERKAQDPFLGQPCKCDVEKHFTTDHICPGPFTPPKYGNRPSHCI